MSNNNKIELNNFISKKKKNIQKVNERFIFNRDIYNFIVNQQPEVSYEWTEKGLGELFADIYKNKCRYCPDAHQWFYYNGKVWKMDSDNIRISRYAKELKDYLFEYVKTFNDSNLLETYSKFINSLGSLNKRNKMIQDARDKYPVYYCDFDKDDRLFNCQNGIYHLDACTFMRHNPEFLLTKISNVFYDSKIKPKYFEKFIDEIFENNTGKRDYIKKLFGYILTADTSLETMFILYGESTRNGKSTLLETISYMMGGSEGYALTTNPEIFAIQNRDSRKATGNIARLNQCRLVCASELSQDMVLDISLLKTFTGRDMIVARHVYEKEFEFVPKFKIILNTNHLPTISDNTVFDSNRINVIPFEKHFSIDEQDVKLKEKLKERNEISGIFNWCIEGLKLFEKEKLTPPISVKNATKEYSFNSNEVLKFVDDAMQKSDKTIKAMDVYNAYCQWSTAEDKKILSKQKFYDKLRIMKLLSSSGTIDGKTHRKVIKNYSIKESYLLNE